MKLLSFFAILFFGFFPSLVAENIVRRVAFDIGSMTTKMLVADVDTERNKVQKVLLARAKQVGYKKDIKLNGGIASDDIVNTGIAVMLELKKEADSLPGSPAEKEYSAVATASLRGAKNCLDIITRLSKGTGIPARVIPQEDEARLGFNGAVNETGTNPHNAVVWDMGGGSMQITTLNQDGKLISYGNEVGMIPFSNYVMQNIQHKQITPEATPNPMTAADVSKAINLSYLIA